MQITRNLTRARCHFCGDQVFAWGLSTKGNAYCRKHVAEGERNAPPFNARVVEHTRELEQLAEYQASLPGAQTKRFPITFVPTEPLRTDGGYETFVGKAARETARVGRTEFR